MLWSAMKVDSLLTTVLQKQSFFCICFSVCPICRHLQTTLLLINVIMEDLWRKLFIQLLCFAQLQRLLELLLPLFHIIFQQFFGRRSIPSWISSCTGFRKSNKLKAKMKELFSRKLKKYHGEDNLMLIAVIVTTEVVAKFLSEWWHFELSEQLFELSQQLLELSPDSLSKHDLNC